MWCKPLRCWVLVVEVLAAEGGFGRKLADEIKRGVRNLLTAGTLIAIRIRAWFLRCCCFVTGTVGAAASPHNGPGRHCQCRFKSCSWLYSLIPVLQRQD